jgi:hypothetical protein
MVTIFFNGVGQFYVNVLLQKQKMNLGYFTEKILTGVAEICAREETVPKENLAVHFDNVPMRNTEMAREMLTEWNIARMDEPPYSPDLAPCNFLLFGYMK